MTSILRGSDEFDSGKALGVGQSYVNYTGIKLANTDQINNTPDPLHLSIRYTQSGSGSALITIVGFGEVAWGAQVSTSGGQTLTAIIPSGTTYRVEMTGGNSVNRWVELRS